MNSLKSKLRRTRSVRRRSRRGKKETLEPFLNKPAGKQNIGDLRTLEDGRSNKSESLNANVSDKPLQRTATIRRKKKPQTEGLSIFTLKSKFTWTCFIFLCAPPSTYFEVAFIRELTLYLPADCLEISLQNKNEPVNLFSYSENDASGGCSKASHSGSKSYITARKYIL